VRKVELKASEIFPSTLDAVGDGRLGAPMPATLPEEH